MEGRVFSYIHFNGQVGSLVKISTVTDFAARTDEFMAFGKEIAMQVAMTNPQTLDDLLKEEFIRDSILIGDRRSVRDITDAISKTLGEKVDIVAFERFAMRK